MKVHQLNLVNFHGFEQIELKFEPDVNVIAGVNGVGKSGILQALATLFSRALPEFTPSTAKPISFSDEDVYHDKLSLEASAIFAVADQQCHMGIQRVVGDNGEGDRWNRFWRKQPMDGIVVTPVPLAELLATRTLTGDLESSKAETERELRKLKDRSAQPVVIFFSPKRQLPGRPKTLPKLKPFEIANAYGFALQDREVELREFMYWFRVMKSEVVSPSKRGTRILDKLRQAVAAFVPEFTNLQIEEQPTLQFLVEKSGTPLALNQLSDGERGLLAILFDITRRLTIANPDLDDPIANGEGIILIDEIELHLHPKWQRTALRRLAQTFKNCQFIVTSHSPQVIGQVRPESLRVLHRDDFSSVKLFPVAQSFGMDSNWILEQIMGTTTRDYETEQKLKGIFDSIDVGDFAATRERIAQLEAEVGLFAELQEAKSMLDRLEILVNDEKNNQDQSA